MTRSAFYSKRFYIFIISSLLILLFAWPVSAMEKPLTQSQSELTTEGDLPSTCAESSLLDLAVDATLEESGCQIALLPAQAVSGSLDQGAVFQSDLERIIAEDQPLLLAEISPAELKEILETGLSRLTKDSSDKIDVSASAWEGFPHMAGGEGFSWEYDVSAPVGERVQYIKWQGKELDLSDQESKLMVCSVPAMFDGSLSYPQIDYEEAGISLRQALHDYCVAQESLEKPASRSTAIGSGDYTLISKFPKSLIIAICVFISLFVCIPKWKAEKYFSFKK